MSAMKQSHLMRRLLSGKNQLSRPEKDEIFENVLGQVAPPARSVWRLAPALVLASVAALVLIPLAINNDDEDPTQSEFTARGQGSATGAFSMACADNSDACQPGDKLVFDLSASSGYRYFAAFAKRTDGAVIWYFPESPGGESLDLHQQLQDGVLDRGVVLGSDHQTGRYQVYGIFSAQPLTRTEIKERFDLGATSIGSETSVLRQELVIR